MIPNNEFADLEEQLTQALRSKKPPPSAQRPGKQPKLPPQYHNLETWTPRRVVALIHQGEQQQTLLGNFREYTHPQLRGARQLRRISEPTPCDTIEFVSGQWWLTGQQELLLSAPQRWVEQREMLLDITLKELDLYAPGALCKVRLYLGAYDQVVLGEETRFICPSRQSFLFLPQGLDVLPAMAMESKMALREQLDAQEPPLEPQDEQEEGD